MFEFATSQHQKKKLSKSYLYSSALSLASHAAAVLLLIQFPELLQGGHGFWFLRSIPITESIPDPKSRVVTFVYDNKRMQAPPIASIQAYLYQALDKALRQGSPPIRVRWGDEKKSSSGEADEAAKPVRAVPGTQDPKPVPADEAGAPPQAAAAAADAGSNVSTSDGSGQKPGTVYLPAPSRATEPREIPKKTVEVAGNTAPTRIPDSASTPGTSASGSIAKPPNPAQSRTTAKVFENEQQAIQAEGSGLFNTRGFPLGDYATLIIERVKGHWFIPSNLRNSQGQTTVIFFIDKDGGLSDARIVASSGSESLNLAALSAVLGSRPFPPLPKGFPGNHVGAKFVFSYNERQ
jgi:protein TonB